MYAEKCSFLMDIEPLKPMFVFVSLSVVLTACLHDFAVITKLRLVNETYLL